MATMHEHEDRYNDFDDSYDKPLTKKERTSGITYLLLFGFACLLATFLFLVCANVAGAAISALLGIGASLAR